MLFTRCFFEKCNDFSKQFLKVEGGTEMPALTESGGGGAFLLHSEKRMQ
jgi:hypothetical protein